MEIVVKDGQGNFKDICLKSNGKELWMFFTNVGDLYWSIGKSTLESTMETFDIPDTEREIFSLFDKLYYEIENGIIFSKRDSKRYKLLNRNRNLFNPVTKIIEWHSDETYFDSDDVVKIIKQEHNYHIEFTRPEAYKDPFYLGSGKNIYIRFRTSGSYYHPFHACFVRLYKNMLQLGTLLNVDD